MSGMRSLRALWHPLTPLAVVLVILPLLTLLLASPAQRAPDMLGIFLLSFPAAWLSVRALRGALARIPVPEGAPEPTYHEQMLARGMRWLLVLVSIFGTLSLFLAALGVKEWRPPPAQPDPTAAEFALAPQQSIALVVLPLLFAIFGLQLWVHLASARRRRAQGQMPLPFKPASTTGDEKLDERLRPRARAALVLGLVASVGSALANLLRYTPMFSRGTEGVALIQFWRFFTASFVHQDVGALVVGILGFAAVAPLVEALLGRSWLVIAVLGGGFVATVTSFVFVPGDFMGLTGVDAALVGLLAFFGLLHRHRLPPATTVQIAVRCLVALVIVAFASVLVPAADVAAAFGGFGAGMLLSPVARPRPEVREALERTRAEALAQGA